MRGPGPGRHQQWHTESVARIPGTNRPVWRYWRVEETGTPWVVEYVPTGQTGLMGTITAARRWTAAGAAAFLRDSAARVVADGGRTGAVVLGARGRRVAEDPSAAAARVAAARRHLAIHDGLMLPAGGTHPTVTTCTCGGLLTDPGGHLDACAGCYTAGVWKLPCPREAGHHCCVPEGNPTHDHRDWSATAGAFQPGPPPAGR